MKREQAFLKLQKQATDRNAAQKDPRIVAIVRLLARISAQNHYNRLIQKYRKKSL